MRFKPAFLILLFICADLCAQDTTIYYQANAAMFSNYYKLIKKNKTDNYGNFTQRCLTDDLNTWFGYGTFEETSKKISLKFDSSLFQNRTEEIKNADQSDTITIKWLTWYGEQVGWFSIRYIDTIKNKTIYNSNLENGFVKIAGKDLMDKRLSLYAFGMRKIFDFTLSTNKIGEVKIFANDTISMHTFAKKRKR